MARKVATPRTGGGVRLQAQTRGWTPRKRKAFLEMLGQTANVRMAVRSVDMSEPGAYKLRARDPAFAQAWADALSEGYAKLEMLLLERALSGLADEPVAPGDGRKAAALSERTILTLLSQHRQSVRDHRIAAAKDEGIDLIAEEAAARAALSAKLAEMHQRLCGDDAEDNAE